MTDTTNTDSVMEAIALAVADGCNGNIDAARTRLLELWDEIGVAGDPLHRCSLAHYLADLHDDPAQSLMWDVRALDAAASLTDRRAQEHHASLQVAGFYPSLYLNLADDFRCLGSFDAARDRLAAARQHSSALPDDAYGNLIRTAVDEVAAAVEKRDTAPRASAPSTGG